MPSTRRRAGRGAGPSLPTTASSSRLGVRRAVATGARLRRAAPAVLPVPPATPLPPKHVRHGYIPAWVSFARDFEMLYPVGFLNSISINNLFPQQTCVEGWDPYSSCEEY